MDNNGTGTWSATIKTPKNLASGTKITVTCFGLKTNGQNVNAIVTYTVK